jgi:hypothetical protein
MTQPDLSEASGPAACDRVSGAGTSEPALVGELRDAELAISLWRRKAAECGGLPPPAAFDLSRMVDGASNHRFVICANAADELSFLIYGSRLAQLLQLPVEPITGVSITRQLPARYQPLFIRGCRNAIAQSAPVRLSGVVVDYGQIELYRAAFMPLAMPGSSSMQLVFGTFNRLIGPQAHSSDAVRAMYNSLIADIRSEKPLAACSEEPAPGPSAGGRELP